MVHVKKEKKLCSLCGLCMVTAWPAAECRKLCVFETGWLGEKEQELFGRERSLENPEEMRFGIARRRLIARLREPVPGAQFTGIITRMAVKALESGLVEAVSTLHRSGQDYFFPEPVLARTTEAVLAGRGSKPVLAQTLVALEEACRQGVKKLLVIGTPCIVHNLRSFARETGYLKAMELYTVGIPCTDNANPKRFRWMLRRVSRSHATARHIEYMQDFSVHITHEGGRIERVPFFSFPQELSGTNVFAPSCLSCFDYMNSLSDIVVGYLAAPLDRQRMPQWVLARTDKGEQLLELVAGELETSPEFTAGDCASGISMYTVRLLKTMQEEASGIKKTGRAMSLKQGMEVADMLCETGPRGLEFAKYAVDMHLVRNYHYVKFHYPGLLAPLVPKHVYRVLEEYDPVP